MKIRAAHCCIWRRASPRSPRSPVTPGRKPIRAVGHLVVPFAPGNYEARRNRLIAPFLPSRIRCPAGLLQRRNRDCDLQILRCAALGSLIGRDLTYPNRGEPGGGVDMVSNGAPT